MRRLVFLVALLSLPSCSVLRDAGTAACTQQEQVAVVLTDLGERAGLWGAGTAATDIVNTGLEFFCTIFDSVVSAPADIGDELGLTVIPPEESDAEAEGS